MKFFFAVISLIFFSSSLYGEEEKLMSLNSLTGQKDFIDLSGSLGFYYRDLSNREPAQAREEFGNAQFWLKALTAQWQGFRLGVSGLHNGEFADEENGYSNNIIDRKAILAEVFVEYTISKTVITVGRRVKGPDDGSWIMLDDFYEGVFIESEDIPGFAFRTAWVYRTAVFDPDEVTHYDRLAGGEDDTDGVYALEASWQQVEGLRVSGVYYRANGAYSFAGSRIDYEFYVGEGLSSEFVAEYYSTWENGNHGQGLNVTGGRDKGGIFHIGNTFSFGNISFGGGYIKADRKVGAGSLTNNPWDPFEEDDFHTQIANARTWYLTAGYTFTEDLSMTLVYGETNADVGGNESASFNQFNAIIAWQVHEQISLEAGYVLINTSDNQQSGFEKMYANVIFTF